jgi:MFS family permease
MVALVQTASTLPVFLLGIASGAMADIVDRRRWFAATQAWVCATALVLALLALAGGLNAPLLLLLTFVNGIGLAARWPVFSAIVPDVVSEAGAAGGAGAGRHLDEPVARHRPGDRRRAAGDQRAGGGLRAQCADGGVAFWLILRWKSEPRASALPGERFVGAMRVGLQHVRQSPRMRVIIARVFLFFLQASALLALLPLVARSTGGGAGMYTAMMSCLGAGAIAAALQFPRWRERFDRDQFVHFGTVAHALLSTLIVCVPTPWLMLPAMALVGASWISTANSLVLSAQQALPNWVRARGMSIYQMALMGGTAIGAGLWGQAASFSSVPLAVVAAALTGVVLLYRDAALDGRRRRRRGSEPAAAARRDRRGAGHPARRRAGDGGH